jgi:hypothetical protein
VLLTAKVGLVRSGDNKRQKRATMKRQKRVIKGVMRSGQEIVSVEKESKVSSDNDKEMNISNKEKSKATMNETLQNFKLDSSNMGQNSPTGEKRSRARTTNVWKSILRFMTVADQAVLHFG